MKQRTSVEEVFRNEKTRPTVVRQHESGRGYNFLIRMDNSQAVRCESLAEAIETYNLLAEAIDAARDQDREEADKMRSGRAAAELNGGPF